MTNPTECKYCGCEEVATKTDSEIVFRCWSSYLNEDDHWTVSNNCGARCAVQLVELRARVEQDLELIKAREANVVTAMKSRLRTLNERIQRAVELLKGQDRIIMVLDENDKDVVPATDVDQVIEILEGEADGKAD